MKKNILISLMLVLFLLLTSCISATLTDFIPPSHGTCAIHPIDAILFSDPEYITERMVLLSNGNEELKEYPALHIYTTLWGKIRYIDLEPFERAKTELEQTIYLTARKVNLWNNHFVVMNREPYLDFYTFGGDFEKRLPIVIKDSKNIRLTNLFIYNQDLIIVCEDSPRQFSRMVSVSTSYEITKTWSLPFLAKQITSDGKRLYALQTKDTSTLLVDLDLKNEKVTELKALPGIWNEVVFQNSTIYANIKTENGSALVELDNDWQIAKTHWNTQFEEFHMRSGMSGLFVLIPETQAYYFWQKDKDMTLVRDLCESSEANAYFPLCVKKDAFNNLIMLDEDQKVSVINIEVCNPYKYLVYDSYTISNYKLAGPKAFAKIDSRLYFADQSKNLYEMQMETKKPVKIHQFERKVEQIESTEGFIYILLEDSSVWKYANKVITKLDLPAITVLSMTLEDSIPYFLVVDGDKEEIQWLDTNTNALVVLPLHISADTKSINMFTLTKPYSMIATTVFTIESTLDGDMLCIYGGDGKRLSVTSLELIKREGITTIDQIYFFGADKFLILSKKYSTVKSFKGVKVG